LLMNLFPAPRMNLRTENSGRVNVSHLCHLLLGLHMLMYRISHERAKARAACSLFATSQRTTQQRQDASKFCQIHIRCQGFEATTQEGTRPQPGFDPDVDIGKFSLDLPFWSFPHTNRGLMPRSLRVPADLSHRSR
jgi:hypothetical protein